MNITQQKLMLQFAELQGEKLQDADKGIFISYKKSENIPLLHVYVIDSPRAKKIKYMTAKSAEAILSYFERLKKSFDAMNERKTQRSAEKNAQKSAFLEKLKPGVILSASWGYEQTNVEFYKVIAINGHKVKIQELGHKQVGEATSWASCHVVPDENCPTGEVIEKTIAGCSIKINDSVRLDVWCGKPLYKSWYY